MKFFNDKDILNIFCGKTSTIAICNDGVYVWGYNYNGMLGINHSGTIYSPTESHHIDNTNEYLFASLFNAALLAGWETMVVPASTKEWTEVFFVIAMV